MKKFDIRTDKWMCTTPLNDLEMAMLVYTVLEKAGISVHSALKQENAYYSERNYNTFIFMDTHESFVNSAWDPYFKYYEKKLLKHYKIELKTLLQEARKIIENERV